MTLSHACVLREPGESPEEWEEALIRGGGWVVDDAGNPVSGAAGPQSGCVLVDARRVDAVGRVRRSRRRDPAVQAVIVTEPADRGRVEREVLFAPGLGEVWIVGPEEIGEPLVARAAEVTARRRRHRRTRLRLEDALEGLEPLLERRAVISDAYLASLLDAAPDPILSVDASGRILSWNPGAEHVLGFPRAAVLGRPLAEVLDAPQLESATGAPEQRRLEIAFRRSSGESGVAECVVAPVEAAGHRVWAVLLHDLTEERSTQETLEAQAAEMEAQAAEMEMQAAEMEVQARELERHALELERVNAELRERTEELERASAARSRFYANMSHELRTPINAIIGYNALVLDGIYGPVPEKQVEALQRAQRAASHLLELISDVLDLAKIEAGRVSLEAEPVCVPGFLWEVVDTVRSVADHHGSTVEVEGEDSHCISTDPRRLRQILLNLISNALKFGEGRPVTLRWREAGDGGLLIDVEDRGPGIPSEHLDRIFEEFTQLQAPNSGGTGLGLPISRQLASLLGGTVEATSTPGEGSVFRVRLPRALQPGSAPPSD
jgi:PAS domain S-box-containing protein